MESNKQVTAVEWLVKQLCIEHRKTLVNQAKEMEKNSYICNKCKSKINEDEVMQQMQDRKKY